MKPYEWRALAVSTAVLLTGCSVEMLNAFLAAGRPAGLAVAAGPDDYTGRWYACGMANRYVELAVDDLGRISGKSVDKGNPIYEVSGTGSGAFATLKFTPLEGGQAPLTFDVEIVGDSIKGIKTPDGAIILLQRKIDPGITRCPGLDSQASPTPATSPSPLPSPTPAPATPHPSTTPTDTPGPTPTPTATPIFPSTPYPLIYVSDATIKGNWYMCGHFYDLVSFGPFDDGTDKIVDVHVGDDLAAVGTWSLAEEPDTSHAYVTVAYTPFGDSGWIKTAGSVAYYVLPEGLLKKGDGPAGPGFLTRAPISGAERCVVKEP